MPTLCASLCCGELALLWLHAHGGMLSLCAMQDAEVHTCGALLQLLSLLCRGRQPKQG